MTVRLGLGFNSEQAVIAHGCRGHTLDYLSRTVVSLLEVSEREEGVVALHLPTGPLKTCSGLEPVPRC